MSLHEIPSPDLAPQPEPPPPESPSAFSLQPLAFAPDWSSLLDHTEYFAEAEIDGYCWREVSGGVLPSGYDASSIAVEAVAEIFGEVEAGSLVAPNLKELK